MPLTRILPDCTAATLRMRSGNVELEHPNRETCKVGTPDTVNSLSVCFRSETTLIYVNQCKPTIPFR